jgi:hypothetical protein
MAPLIVDAQVFPEDLIRDVRAGEVAATTAILSALVPYVPDLETDTVIGHALQALPLSEGPREDWLRPYAESGLGAYWLERVVQLRVWSDPGFCVVHGIPASAWWCEDDGIVLARQRRGRALPAGPQYTLPVTVQVPKRSAERGPRPQPSKGDRHLRPADAHEPHLLSLAAHLAPRIARLPGGKTRLDEAPALAPLFAMAATISIVMTETSQERKKGTVFRDDVLAVCLDALDLGQHRRTAERILLRDDPEHLHVDAWTTRPGEELHEHIAPRKLRDGLGLYAHDDRGDLVGVGRADRARYRPHILYSLAGPEPR